MQFWQCSISLQFLQIITAKDFAFGSLQNLHLLTSADCSVSLHTILHCNSKCIAVIPLQFPCDCLKCKVIFLKIGCKNWLFHIFAFLRWLVRTNGEISGTHFPKMNIMLWGEQIQ